MPPRKQNAPSGGKIRATASSSKRPAAATDIYNDLVAEATSGTDLDSYDDRPLKRRKPNVRSARAAEQSEQQVVASSSRVDDNMIADDASDDDLAFENVDLHHTPLADDDSVIEDVNEASAQYTDSDLEDINITIHQEPQVTSPSTRRKVTSRIEKHLRVLGHKAHVVALLGHCVVVNSRCNDRRVQKVLKQILDTTTRSRLRPSKDHTQFQQNRTFTMGLDSAMQAFKNAYKVTKPGMRRPYWREGDDTVDVPQPEILDRNEFLKAARQLSGSQDVGNQLFCAMLRGCGVQARIVCSLQVLPLSNHAAPPTPITKKPARVFAIAPDIPLDITKPNLSLKEKAIASARSRMGQPAFRELPTTPPKKKVLDALMYPVFWVEVFNTAYQKWMPADPVVTQTVGKASALEPPAAYPANQLVYAIAFAKDSSARDVTRRYAKAYNAKTRRMRLESVSEMENMWLKKTLRMFATRKRSSSDAIEEADLTQRVAREGLPRNVQDFKDHPIYALERHLKRHEVIYPRKEAGKFNAGTNATPKMEAIFRRENVHTCRSADQWFRLGRKIKPGEQPVKLVPARRKDDEEEQSTALYLLSQTELYIPDPVVRGRVPKNAFGNLDVYVPSMVPAGGAHVRHPLAKTAAAILEIDAVDAVTGFRFANRKGTTVIEGAVVPEGYDEAVQAVIEGLLWQELDERAQARSALAMRMWKKFLAGLRIAERVASYATEPVEEINAKETNAEDMTASTAWYTDEELELHTAGKYTLDQLTSMAKQSKKVKPVRSRPVDSESEHDYEATSSPAQLDGQYDDEPGGFLPDDDVEDTDASMDGGFIADDERGGTKQQADLDEERSGGFMVDMDEPEHGNISGEFTMNGQGESHDDQESIERLGRYDNQEADIGGGFMVGADDSLPSQATNSPDEDSSVVHDADRVSVIDFQANTQEADPSEADAQEADVALSTLDIESVSPHQAHSMDEDGDSLLSHDPEDDDAEPDWMESE